jgi:23S rRNA pseudouridine1911/1915/1917 synthase
MSYAPPKKEKKHLPRSEWAVHEPTGLLDFLLAMLPRLSRNSVKSLLSHREVFVDGQAVTQYDHPLQTGQSVRIIRSVTREHEPANQIQILHEDSELLVINKPAGLLTVATDQEQSKTAYTILTDYIQKHHSRERIYVVHRLDRDTSGVLLFAKNEKLKLALQDRWDSLVSKRCYAAVVEGHPIEKSGTIRSWLKQSGSLRMYSSHRAGDGLEAITLYRVVQEVKDYSLLSVELQTGRKNQIRVHMKELGHPVVGDVKYGSKVNPIRRLALHACRLALTHPFFETRFCFDAELPEQFKNLVPVDSKEFFLSVTD